MEQSDTVKVLPPPATADTGGTGLRALAILAAGLLLLAAGWLLTDPLPQIAVFTSAATLLALGALLCLSGLFGKRRFDRVTAAADAVIEHDSVPAFIVTAGGQIEHANPAAKAHFGTETFTTLAALLDRSLADAAARVADLQSRAAAQGHARADAVTRGGQLRLSTHRVGRTGFIWRIEVLPPTLAQGPGAQAGAHLPRIVLGRTDAVLSMNEPARRLLGGRIKSLDRIFTNLPLTPGTLAEITTQTGPCRVLVSELEMGAGRRALFLLPAPKSGAVEAVQGWQAFHDLPVPMIKVAPDGAVQSFNRMAARLIGTELEEGVHLSRLMEGLGRSITDWLSDTLADRMVQKSEFLRLSRTDRETFVQVVLNRITEDGEPALIAVMHDATELKSLEAQFVQSQKMQAIGQLAGGVAHDFNNLLTAISGHCDLLLLRHDQGDVDYGDLVQINQNANRAAALVSQLLAFSRKQTLRPETLDLRDTLADLTHLLNRLVGEKVTLTLSHDPVLWPVRADKRQLEQVLMNLVVNARDAMQAGGEIRIVTECLTLKEPLSRDRVVVPAGAYVTVEVSDDGAGIAPDKREKVFEPFYTTKRTGEGTGLGLSTAYGIIKQTGGFIFVDSTPGVGTTFMLYFPVHDLTATARTAPPKAIKAAPMPTNEGVVLLVEDEAPVRAFASRALRLRGYTVLEAESAEAALKTLEDRELNIDVFVTDVVMPGMDGPSWVRLALKQRPNTRVVFVSGYAEDSFGEEQTRIPNSVFLPKPFSLNQLTDTVHEQLH